jgi:hypothetical protein
MPTPLEERTKDGVPTLIKRARQMCDAVHKFAPIIRAKYPDNVTLMAALVAAEVMCATFIDEFEAIRQYGD